MYRLKHPQKNQYNQLGKNPAFLKKGEGFTLIELIIVVGIIGTLSVVVVMLINPVELFRQARDSNRLTQINSLSKAINIIGTEQSLGSAEIIYISVPDPAILDTAAPGTRSDCSGLYPLGLVRQTLPPGWTYQCVSARDLRKTDGNGWAPINFDAFSSGAPISALPIDPINTVESGYYYSYVSDGRFALASALMESLKYLRNTAATDGGTDPARYETGSRVPLWTAATGLVGYWKLDEDATNVTVADSSGQNNHGAVVSGSLGPPTLGVPGKVGTAARFRANYGFVEIDDNPVLTAGREEIGPGVYKYKVSIAGWFYRQSSPGFIFGDYDGSSPGYGSDSEYGIEFAVDSGDVKFYSQTEPVATLFGLSPVLGQWSHLVVTWDGTTLRLYENGIQIPDPGGSEPFSVANLLQGGRNFRIGARVSNPATTPLADAVVDDLRVYNRTLSPAEVAAIYNATK